MSLYWILDPDASLTFVSVGIFGPPDTLYEGGYFKADMEFPNTYPFAPPKVGQSSLYDGHATHLFRTGSFSNENVASQYLRVIELGDKVLIV